MFQVPVPELEYAPVDVDARHVTAGQLVYSVKEGLFRKAAEVRHGSKFVTVLAQDGTTIARAEFTEKVEVKRATEESRSAASKALTKNRLNKRLRERLEENVLNGRQLEVLAKLTEAAKNGYRPSSFTTSDLLTAQARDEVEARFSQMLEHALEKDENTDLQEVLRRAVELFSAEVVRRARNVGGLSRSTSVVSNAMEDAVTAAYAKFIDDAEYDL